MAAVAAEPAAGTCDQVPDLPPLPQVVYPGGYARNYRQTGFELDRERACSGVRCCTAGGLQPEVFLLVG